MSEEIKIIDGAFKKDDPHEDIGKQKFRVRRHYTTWVEYDVVAESKQEAEEAVSEFGGIERVEWQEDYYNGEPIEVYATDYNFDGDADHDYDKYRGGSTKKVAECVPYEDHDFDEGHFENYEDPEWTTDEFRWKKEEKEIA